MNSSGETNNPETNEKQTVRKGVREMAATDVGIDLGTASILVYVRGKGVVLKEPSVVAYDRDTNKIKAIGEEARLMLGRTPGNIIAVRPMAKGRDLRLYSHRADAEVFYSEGDRQAVLSKAEGEHLCAEQYHRG